MKGSKCPKVLERSYCPKTGSTREPSAGFDRSSDFKSGSRRQRVGSQPLVALTRCLWPARVWVPEILAPVSGNYGTGCRSPQLIHRPQDCCSPWPTPRQGEWCELAKG